jgi:hypothetical protein
MVQKPEAIVRAIPEGPDRLNVTRVAKRTTMVKGNSNAKTRPLVKGVDERT